MNKDDTKAVLYTQNDRAPFFGADVEMAAVLDSKSTADTSVQVVRAANAQTVTNARILLALHSDPVLSQHYACSVATAEH